MEDPNDDPGHRASLTTDRLRAAVNGQARLGRRARIGRVRAYIGLGSNLGDAVATLGAAVVALGALRGTRLVRVSRLYATAPWGVVDQPEFRNAVVALDVPGGRDPATAGLDLLAALKDLERGFGRPVDHPRWGPRRLDLDLLVFGRARLSVARGAAGRSTDPAKADLPLTVPHPLARERLFVLAPLADVAPGLVPPGWGERVATARARRAGIEGPAAVRPIGAWDEHGRRWRLFAADDEAAATAGRGARGAS